MILCIFFFLWCLPEQYILNFFLLSVIHDGMPGLASSSFVVHDIPILKKESNIKFIYFYTTKFHLKASCLYNYINFQAYLFIC